MKRSAAGLVLAILVAAPASAQTAPGARVLVLPFSVRTEATASVNATAAPYWLGEASAILLTDELQAIGFVALDRSDRLAAFDGLHLPSDATLTHATMIRVGEVVGASEIIFGDIVLGDRLTVHARIVRLAAGQELPEVTDQAPIEDLFGVFGRVAGRVNKALGRSTVVAANRPPPPSLDAFENYVKGLVAASPATSERFLMASLRSTPGYDRARLALWNVLSNEGAYDRALAMARAVPSTSALFRQARFCAVESLIELTRYAEAFLVLGVLDSERASPVISNALGVVRLRAAAGVLPDGPPATEFFTRAAKADPENADYLFNLGYAYAVAHDSENALFWLREAVRVQPADGDAHLVLSALLTSGGRATEAQREFDLAKLLGTSHTIDGTAPVDRVPRGLERLRTDLDAAPAVRLDLAAADPTQRDQEAQAMFHLEQGRRFFEQERDREAIDELRRAVYLSPYADEPHLLLGRLYLRAGNTASAIDEFKLAIWCKETFEGHLALGNALLAAGQRDPARVEAQRALELRPDSPEARDLLRRAGGQTLFPQKQAKKCQRSVERPAARPPTSGTFWPVSVEKGSDPLYI